MNKNYLKIYNKNEKTNSLLRDVFLNIFSNFKISKRQKIMLTIASFCLGIAFYIKLNAQSINHIIASASFLSPQKVLLNAGISPDLASNWSGLAIIKIFLQYISDIQLKSIDIINNIPFGDIDMFDFITNGLTIFAVIGCLYRLVMHFLNTERFDNVKAYTGFFGYVGIALLFIFSSEIVDRIVSLSEPINAQKMQEMTQKLNDELDKVLILDLKNVDEQIKEIKNQIAILETQKENEMLSVSTNLQILKENLHIAKLMVVDGNFALTFKYTYFSIFIMLLSSIMAIPGFILSVMVKVLLTIMVAGTKLVFLLAFIPGFESTWKTFLLNMLNILLWIPIFNAIYSLIVALIITMMAENSLGTGQIVWLTIVSMILAQQSISLTTSAAGTIINGAGASMAGAMGAISSMSGTSMAMGAMKGAVGVATTVAGGAVGAKMGTSSALGKYMKK